MIRPPARDGVAFSERSDGDLRGDLSARRSVSTSLGISEGWATVRQVQGADTIRVESPGEAGEADALWTSRPDLPLAVFTADCFGVVIHARSAVGVAHTGWRGAESGVVAGLRRQMTTAGHEPTHAAVGPGIGPCCFEVGPDVAVRFDERLSQTTWGTQSVDLPSVIGDQLRGLEVWFVSGCTHHDDGWFSHRRDGTDRRLATLGWLR